MHKHITVLYYRLETHDPWVAMSTVTDHLFMAVTRCSACVAVYLDGVFAILHTWLLANFFPCV